VRHFLGLVILVTWPLISVTYMVFFSDIYCRGLVVNVCSQLYILYFTVFIYDVLLNDSDVI